jgi:hypothetical protein
MVCPFDLNDDGANLLLLKKADVAHLLFFTVWLMRPSGSVSIILKPLLFCQGVLEKLLKSLKVVTEQVGKIVIFKRAHP